MTPRFLKSAADETRHGDEAAAAIMDAFRTLEPASAEVPAAAGLRTANGDAAVAMILEAMRQSGAE